MRALVCVLLTSLAIVSCDGTRPIGKTKITIESPIDGSTTLSFKPFRFAVTARNNLGIETVELYVGEVLAKTCAANGASDVECAIDEVLPTDFSAQVKNGELLVRAKAIESKGGGENELVNKVAVKPIRVAFVEPVASGEPPVAVVTGTSKVKLDVESQVVIDRVQLYWVNGGSEILIRPFSSPYEEEIEWATYLNGKGDRVIKVEAVDSEGSKDSALLNVRVE
jgi:hypothetical protein